MAAEEAMIEPLFAEIDATPAAEDTDPKLGDAILPRLVLQGVPHAEVKAHDKAAECLNPVSFISPRQKLSPTEWIPANFRLTS